ncbi:nitroreductase family deazaflavin-dependent oxidoreductase [Nocardia sp. CA-107356]|uniref:nitroreductase family deazaflavin-dependent oxidoreductase n=1 Tax=Nocardia sp. CA-107356 TaxID=3239972 RepID=UPI003D93C574
MTNLGARLLRTRWFVRAPIGLIRARLGFLFGGRILLLEHIGRKSGLPRYAVLEVVSHPKPDTFVIASGFGRGSQWYRNLAVEPHCRVSVGWRNRAPAMARMLDQDECRAVLADYRIRHPKAYRELAGMIEEAIGTSIDEVPLVELTLVT